LKQVFHAFDLQKTVALYLYVNGCFHIKPPVGDWFYVV
jgi:hypothetical protein